MVEKFDIFVKTFGGSLLLLYSNSSLANSHGGKPHSLHQGGLAAAVEKTTAWQEVELHGDF